MTIKDESKILVYNAIFMYNRDAGVKMSQGESRESATRKSGINEL